MKRAIFIFFAIAITGLLIWTLIYLYGKSQEKPVTFNTETGVYTDIIQKTVATGSVLPRKEIEIKPVVSGIVDQLYIEPGQLVKEGDLLARVKVIPDMVTLNNAENRLERAEIAMDDAKLDFDRNKGLFDKGVISYADYQPFDLARRNAKSEMNAAEDNLKIIRDGVSKKNSSAANTLVRSTISGMVLAVPIEVGNSVIEVNNFNEGTSIATIADMTDLIFIGNVDESEVGKIREGMELILTIGAIENESFKAILEYISPKGIEENGAIQFEIKAAVDLLDNQFIRAGYSANADVVLAVPIEVGNSVIEVNNFNEGTSIATIADMTDLIFIGNVDESEVGKIREGMELILTIGAIENESFKAILEYISPKGIEENGAIQFEIKAAVDLLDNQFIRAGYSANADVVLARRDSVLAINEGLIQYEGDTATFVEVKNGTGYERRAIQTGLSDGIFIEVLSGVAVDDEIKIWNKPITE